MLPLYILVCFVRLATVPTFETVQNGKCWLTLVVKASSFRISICRLIVVEKVRLLLLSLVCVK